MPAATILFNAHGPDATAGLARRLAGMVRAGDVLLLAGPVGAGKTHFARSLIQARLAQAGLREDVPSPTFTLVQTYDDGRVPMVHADLYRLSSVDEVFEIGLADAFDTAVTVIEWPDRMGSDRPQNALSITFDPGAGDDDRRITLSGEMARWGAILSDLERGGDDVA